MTDASSCPSLEALEAHADGPDDPEVAAHLEQCAGCRQQLGSVRQNNALLERLRRSRDLDPDAAARAVAAPDIPGYEDFVELHRGGQGVVYRAVQTATRRTVAVKVLLAGAFATSRQRRRFEREIELVAGLRHPHIVTVYDSGRTADGRHWLAMEYLPGAPLDEYVQARRDGDAPRAQRLALRDLLRLFARICDAVSAAHRRGIIHRDLKPANVLVAADGTPHVVDFGLARPVDPQIAEGEATVTVGRGFLGTLAYAAPEQATGDPAQVDVRSDVYALGVMLYESLAGRLPYPVTGRMSDVLDAIATAPPRPLRGRDAYRVDGELETIVLKALAKDPSRRYQSAEALRSDVERYLKGEPIEARRDSGLYVLRKTLRRYRLQTAAAAAFVLLLAASSIVTGRLYARARAETEKVRQINVFLEDTLGSAEPPAQGELTVGAMLDEGVHWIDLVLGDQPEIEAEVRGIIGNAYRNIGRLEDAEAQLEASLVMRRRLFGDRHPEVTTPLSGLGLLRMVQGRPAAAERYFAEALAIRREAHGDDHLRVAMALSNLANARRALGRLEEAERLYAEAHAIRRRQRGDRHPDTAMSQFMLAEVAAEQGDDARAQRLHEAVLETRRAVLHAEHPDLARSLVALGALRLRVGSAAEAEPLLREALRRHEHALPDDHWRTAKVRCLLGECLAALGRRAEAERLLLAGCRDLERALGSGDPETQSAFGRLADLYERWGSPEKAQRWRSRLAGGGEEAG